jgi:hypothetical protein
LTNSKSADFIISMLYIYISDVYILTIPNMDNIQIRFTPVQVKINNDDTLLHNQTFFIL